MPKVSPKKSARKSSKKKSGRRLGLFCLFLFVAATLAAGFYFMVLYPGTQPGTTLPVLSGQSKKKPLHQETEPLPAPLYEEPALPHQAPPVATRPKKAEKKPLTDRPFVAIVIDDMGYRQNTGKALLALDLPLSFAFLPFTPFSDELQQEAQARGRDILLHLPLEPMDPKANPGPGALSTAMGPDAMQDRFREDLQAVPKAIGVNNHMGSRFTANPQAMRTLLAMVRTRGLFFLDSVTAADSVAYDLALAMGVKAERRTVFLDNDQNPDKIMAQLDLLIRLAGEHGQAVGIGHPYPATVEALRRYQSQLRTRTEMVGVSRLVH
ncbi:MAG: divergent polysaccharide deacetylase family protein [Deltaproteobacteria bacterium]|nr:divergent polysaccharide deacetylase family protein [Deltaproteobacteria bacterium]